MAEVVGGDGEEVFAELEFQDGAGGGDFGAGLGEFAFAIDLAVAGVGERGFQFSEFREQFGAEDGLVFVRGGDEAVEQTADLADAGAAEFHESGGEELRVRAAAFGELVAHAALALADGGADEFNGLVLGNGAAGLGGLEGGAGREFSIERIERSLGGDEQRGDPGRCAGQGPELADVVLRILPDLFGADAAMPEVVFEIAF